MLFDVFEVEFEGLRVLQVARGGELLGEGEEFVVGAAVIVHFYIGQGREGQPRVSREGKDKNFQEEPGEAKWEY